MTTETSEEKGKTQAPMFKRSKDRSHIINATWIYDRSFKMLGNLFRYTAGSLYETDKLEERHVLHVLVGYYVRRAMNLFVGDSGCCAVRMPLTKEFTKRMQFVNTQRFILYLPKKQEVTPTILVVFNQMIRMYMRIAIDVYSLIYTRWAQMVKNFAYAVVDMNQDVDEQLYLLQNIKLFAPEIKSIAKCSSIAQCREAFAHGIDYCSCHEIPPELCLMAENHEFSQLLPTMFADVCAVIKEQFAQKPSSEIFLNFLKRYSVLTSYVKPVVTYMAHGCRFEEDLILDPTYEQAVAVLEPKLVRTIECILCLQLLSFRFSSDEMRRMGINGYAPLKMALCEAAIWADFGPEDLSLPYFSMGAIRNLKRFAVSSAELKDPAFIDLVEHNNKIKASYKKLDDLSVIYDAVRCNDLAKVAELSSKDGELTGAKVSSSFENALMWVEGLYKAISSQVRIPENKTQEF